MEYNSVNQTNIHHYQKIIDRAYVIFNIFEGKERSQVTEIIHRFMVMNPNAHFNDNEGSQADIEGQITDKIKMALEYILSRIYLTNALVNNNVDKKTVSIFIDETFPQQIRGLQKCIDDWNNS